MRALVFSALCVACTYAAAQFSDRASNFSIELLHYTQLELDGHVVISPFGIWSLMTGITLGATGQSRSQLTHAFFLPQKQAFIINGYKNLSREVLNPKTTDVTLTSGNFMFLDKGFSILPDFRRTITSDFNAKVTNLNFKNGEDAARDANTIINSSGASVSNVLRSDDFADSRMILTNVITFKGLWKSPFNKSETTVEPFYNEEKQQIGNVNMMYQRGQLPISNIPELKSVVVEFPYGHDENYCMLVILPHVNEKLLNVYTKLETVTMSNIFKRLQSDVDLYGLEDVDIKLPRFKISTNVVLNRPLYNMGVVDIFDPKLANFSRVSNEKIYVSAIVHKADIEVTESGTVASASSSAVFADRMSTPKFHANKPFIYFVMEKPTLTVIFSGIYSKPSVF